MVDIVQKNVNLIEALNDAQQDAKVFRNHCHDISACTNQLFPLMVNAQRDIPDLSSAPGVSEVFNKLNLIMEDALATLRKCGNISTFEQILDHGETKLRLQSLREELQKHTREAATLVSHLMKSKPSAPLSTPA